MVSETAAIIVTGLLATGITVFGSFLTWLLVVVKTQQRLDDHVKDCDKRYAAMAEMQSSRHRENQDALGEIKDELKQFIGKFIVVKN